MISKKDERIYKGMMFLGCSFTWGQGLYYYSNMPTLKEPLPDHFDPKLVTEAHLQYKNRIRYPRLVADHFDTWELVHPFNGGSNHSAIKWFKSWLLNSLTEEEKRFELVENVQMSMNKHNADEPPQVYHFNEFSHAFIQLSQFHRNNFELTHNGQTHNIPFAMINEENKELKELFFDYLSSKNLTIDEWIDLYILDNLKEVKNFLLLCEHYNIKTGIMTWPNEYLPYFEKDTWFKDRLITFDYKGSNYLSINDLMKSNRECEIKHDYESFQETPKDHHPSKICHRIMADSVIKYIEKIG
jgi:hypothetical protein